MVEAKNDDWQRMLIESFTSANSKPEQQTPSVTHLASPTAKSNSIALPVNVSIGVAFLLVLVAAIIAKFVL